MNIDEVLTVFFRTCCQIFSFDEFFALMKRFDNAITKKDCRALLDSSIYVYPLLNDNFITLSGIFTERTFSFQPKAIEVEKSLFVVGHRALPFIDPRMHPSLLTFVYNGNELPKTIFKTTSLVANEYFNLYGPEYTTQYIVDDIANIESKNPLTLSDLAGGVKARKSLDVHLAAFDLTPIIKNEGFLAGDRLNCEIINWDKGVIRVHPVHTKTPHNAINTVITDGDIERQKWFDTFEMKLLESFDMYGPCTCIAEQLTFVYMPNLEELCSQNCGSVEEFLTMTKRIAFEYYGVETRLWRKGKKVPAIGAWNKSFTSTGSNEDIKISHDKEENLYQGYVSENVINAFLKDIIARFIDKKNVNFRKDVLPALDGLNDFLDIYIRDLPVSSIANSNSEKDTNKSSEETHRLLKNQMMMSLKARLAIDYDLYDSFLEFDIAPLRHKACELFRKVYTLIYEIDNSSVTVEKLPSEDVIIISQLLEHASILLEIIETDTQRVKDDLNQFSISLDGMEWTFNDAKVSLLDAIEEEKAKDFIVSH